MTVLLPVLAGLVFLGSIFCLGIGPEGSRERRVKISQTVLVMEMLSDACRKVVEGMIRWHQAMKKASLTMVQASAALQRASEAQRKAKRGA